MIYFHNIITICSSKVYTLFSSYLHLLYVCMCKLKVSWWCFIASVGDHSKRSELNNNNNSSATVEELYRRGTRTPSAEQIQQITAQLRKFGKIEGKNVFYWFQNHKARERQKRRRQMFLVKMGFWRVLFSVGFGEKWKWAFVWFDGRGGVWKNGFGCRKHYAP